MRAARLAAIVLMGLGVLAYSAWLLEFLVPTGVSPVTQPTADLLLANPLFQVTTGIAGLSFAAAGPPLMRLVPVRWTGRLSALTLAGFGLLLVIGTAAPESAPIRVLMNLVFAVGTVSLVMWWPPGWRAWALGGLTLVLVAGMLVALGPAGWRGVFSRAQHVAHTVVILIGGAYVLRTPLAKTRKSSVADAMLDRTRPPNPN
ncbi:hypothetical protein [Amycolatopsis panacis]|nr:hypothetical protein [Amycolatopsis panacis]